MADPSELRAVTRPAGDPATALVQVGFERIHAVERRGGHRVAAHVHRDVELMLPTLGRYQARIDGVTVQVPTGGALLVAPGDRHEDATGQPIGFLSVSLRLHPGPTAGGSRALLATGTPAAARIVGCAPELHAIARRLLQDGPAGDACQARIQDALAAELLWRLIARLPREALAPDLLPGLEQDDFAAAFAAASARHLGGWPGAAVLAHELGLAERTLTARCRTRLGGAPMRLFRRQQMEYARQLLACGTTVAATAAQLGFANPFHFSAVFRRIVGHPPSYAGIDMPAAGAGMAGRHRRR